MVAIVVLIALRFSSNFALYAYCAWNSFGLIRLSYKSFAQALMLVELSIDYQEIDLAGLVKLVK